MSTTVVFRSCPPFLESNFPEFYASSYINVVKIKKDTRDVGKHNATAKRKIKAIMVKSFQAHRLALISFRQPSAKHQLALD